MLKRNQLTTTTPNTLLLGIASNGQRTAITAAARLDNGDTEPDVAEYVGADLWQSIDEVLRELYLMRVPHLMLLTTCDELYQWLQKPVFVEQPEVKRVWVGREVFTVKTGGNPHQWALLRHLFLYVWRCERVPALKVAEALIHD